MTKGWKRGWNWWYNSRDVVGTRRVRGTARGSRRNRDATVESNKVTNFHTSSENDSIFYICVIRIDKFQKRTTLCSANVRSRVSRKVSISPLQSRVVCYDLSLLHLPVEPSNTLGSHPPSLSPYFQCLCIAFFNCIFFILILIQMSLNENIAMIHMDLKKERDVKS